MTKTIAPGVIAALGFVGACGGAAVDTPEAACKSFAAATCQKVYMCLTPDQLALLGGVFGTSESDCEKQAEMQADCAHAMADCPSGKKYDPGAAQSCLDAVNSASCTSLASGSNPDTCSSDSLCK